MNNGIYRLVFNASRGLWMAVSEHVRSRQSGKNSAARTAKRNLSKAERSRTSLFILLLGFGAVNSISVAFADVLQAPNTIPTGLTGTSNITIHDPVKNGIGQLLNIDQIGLKGIINGTNFSIGAASAVNFNHTGGAGSGTLIRINGPKSIIEGALNSPKGAIYLINQNGILFGNGARVDVNGLVASALDIKDTDFLSDRGHLQAAFEGLNRAAYVWGGDANNFKEVVVQVEPDAHIKAALGSSVMLFAPTVINQGSIETTEGQVVMAAGEKVYLSYAPDLNKGANVKEISNYAPDSPYRGLAGVLVEVDSYENKTTGAVEIDGTVINDTMGRILAQRNNVTLAGFLVNQNGRITATSSATQKGSIRLLARDTSAQGLAEAVSANDEKNNVIAKKDVAKLLAENGNSQNTLIAGSRTGKLNIGANSITTVLSEDSAALAKAQETFSTPQEGISAAQSGEYAANVLAAVNTKGATVTDDQVFNAPTIEAIGHQVSIGDNAKIVAPGGFINISAQKSGLEFSPLGLLDSDSRLFLGKNTLIDAAGLKNVSVAMESNFVESLLTLLDLKDDPLNRDGFLYRKKVWFDTRNLPESRVADVAGFVKQVPRALGEKLATAGTVKLQSEGDLIQSTGSKVDVSGGSLLFNTGINKESWVVAANGKAYALGDAPVDTVFTGFLGGTNSFLRQEAGYTEGKAAGAVEVKAVNIALDGQLTGGAVYGERQRESSNLGGKLTIDVLKDPSSLGHDLTIANNVPLSADFTKDDPLPASRINTVEIDAGMLNRSGFENVALSTSGIVKVNEAINLAAGASLSITGGGIEVNKDIVARGGNISLKNQGPKFSVADGVALDVSGTWTNDALNAPVTDRVMTKGGKVTISSADEVTLGTGSLVDVSGGGWLQRDKKLVNGNAGSINIASQVGQSGSFTYKAPVLNGELRGFALGTGGNLAITAPFITVGNSGFGDAREFLATPEFFQDSGFTGFNLTGRDGAIVRSNTNVDVVAKNYVLNRDYSLKATGEKLHNFATATVLPVDKRSSTSLAVSSKSAPLIDSSEAFVASGVSRGSVVVETGASLKVDANGLRKDADGKSVPPSIALSAWDNQLFVDGTLQASGGDIFLTMNGNVSENTDNGYNAAQAIWLGNNAKLLAAGYTQTTPTRNGLRVGTVYDGGNISIDAKKGYVVAEAGSLIDVSGTSSVFDVKNINRYEPTVVASNGGDVSISAREGMLLDSTFKATSSGALAGSLELRLTRGGQFAPLNVLPPYPGTVEIPEFGNPGNAPNQLWYIDVSQAESFVPPSLDVGESIQSAAGGVAKIAANNIMNAGFSDVALKSEHGVRFTGDVDLKASRSISFNAKVIEATADSQVKLTAPNVVISNVAETKTIRSPSENTATTPVVGTANLVVNTNLLDLKGQFSLSGFATTLLNSTGDVRLTGYSGAAVPSGGFKGELLTTGLLSFNARQIYPTSLSDFTVTSTGVGSRISFNGTGSHDKVLSAGGRLTVNAETIDQNGVLLAPFGTIALNASDTLNLNAGSLTSVSAQGALIPFGFTARDGQDYLYSFDSNTLQFKSTAESAAGVAPPERVVKLAAPNINQNTDSHIDISGGGDLFAYEWVPGVGGSADVLANGANQAAFGKGTTATWAIMPASNATFASYDTQYWQGSDIKAGDAVYISGVPGLAAGYFTLLPARYALLPGAMLVSAVSGFQDRPAGQVQTLANGSTLVSGHLAAYTSNGYTQTSRNAGFVVRPGSDANKLAEYKTTTAGTFFKENIQAQQTADAGRLSFAATNSLVLKGILDALPGQNGKGAEVDIAAPKLLVVDAGQATGQVTLDGQTYLAVDETTLANFNVASLLLGGTRGNGKLDVISSDVRMGSNANLSGSELILAATDKVQLDAGAILKGTGAGATAKDLTIGAVADENGLGAVDGDGALVRVSGGKAVQIARLNTDENRGDLIINAGATVEGDGSLQLDASKSTTIVGDIKFKEGAALGFASSRVSLGAPDGGEAVSNGLWLQKEQLDKFVDAGSVFLKSKSTIDIFGGLSFGNNQFDLTLQSAGLAGYQNTGKTATITTRTLTIANEGNVAFAIAPSLAGGTTPALGTGNLNIQAETVLSGNNTVRLAGFDQVDITASKEVKAQGNSAVAPNKLVADQNLTLDAGRVTVGSKADHGFEATNGTLQVKGVPNAPTGLSASESQGAKLSLTGDQVILASGANIDARGAKVTLEATGLDATDSVKLADGSKVDVQGSLFLLNNQTVALPAGEVNLISRNGDVDVQQGASINMSAAGTGDAGKFKVSAVNGQAKIAGTVRAAELGAKGKNAVADVYAKLITDISQTIANLSTFSGAQSYRVREGDVNIAAADSITADNVKIVADNGAISVSGKIDASGDKGGSIEIFAKNDVNVGVSAQLLAKGTADKTSTAGSLGNGGSVLVSSDSGTVKVAAPDANGAFGALIDVTGDQIGNTKGQGGEVIFRAARTGNGAGDGVKVDKEAPAAITGANRVQIEAVKKYSYSEIDASVQTVIADDTNTFAANIAGVMDGYSKTRDGKSAIIAPSVEVKSTGDLTVSSDWVLGGEMPGGGILTLSAANNLILNGNINYIQSQIPNSWSYRLVSGADAGSISPEMVVKGIGNITLADSKFVRTGTGFIHAVAGNDIQLGTENGAGAAIYTLGLEDTTNPVNFVKLSPNDKEFYSDGGGDINIFAGGNVSGSARVAETQDVEKWLYTGVRSDSINGQARWWTRFDTVNSGITQTRSKGFTNGIATLGGGDVSVKTGGDLNNLQIAAADNGRMGGSAAEAPNISNFIELGGGDIDIQTAGSVNQTLLHSAKGDATTSAGGSINVQLSLMDSKVGLNAEDNLAITKVSNATNHISSLSDNKFRSKFYTYSDQASIEATSLTGNAAVTGGDALPPKLFVAAPSGDVNVDSLVLYPSKSGNATLLAGHDVNISSLIMSEVDPKTIPVITTPNLKTAIAPDLSNYQGTTGHTEGLLHIENLEPVRIYAQHDVVFGKGANPLITPKRTEIIAGHDVLDANVIIQNLKSTDVSLIQAGNDIRYSEPELSGDRTLATNAGIQIAGPGRLHLVANADIDLGASNGIQSIGNVNNPYLPEQGADIMVQPGAAAVADYDGILRAYVDPISQYSSTYLPQLTQLMRQRKGNNNLADTEALADFKMLDRQEQTAFINQVFFAELKAGGRDAIDSNGSSFGDYSRSERAILRMFPEFTSNQTLVSQAGSIMKDFGNIANEQITHPGDLSLFYSQIRSERGGRIELLVPGGLVNAGLAVAGGPVKADTDLGIVSLRGGELLGFVRGDFQVNQSRVFTLGGSDLLLYSALEDIDAGKGKKTASSTPPPVVRIVNGQVTYDYSAAVSGSGIAAFTATGGTPGEVDLFAPYGEISAGEAGIRSAGNIFIGARVITGADNIVAGGTTTGAPVASVGGLSVSAPASTDSTSNGKQSDQLGDTAKNSSDNKLAALPSLINVEVISLGDESAPTAEPESSNKKCKDEKNKKDCEK